MTNDIAECIIKGCYVKNGHLNFNLRLTIFVQQKKDLCDQCCVPLMTGLQQTYLQTNSGGYEFVWGIDSASCFRSRLMTEIKLATPFWNSIACDVSSGKLGSIAITPWRRGYTQQIEQQIEKDLIIAQWWFMHSLVMFSWQKSTSHSSPRAWMAGHGTRQKYDA